MYADTIDTQRGTSATDNYGNPHRTFATYLTAVAATVQPATSLEQYGDRDVIVTRYRLHCAPDVDITSDDRVVWRGRTFGVDGDVELHSRRGVAHHLEAYLREVAG